MKEVVGLGPRKGVEPHLCFQDLTQDLTIFPVDNARPVEFYNHQARIVERQSLDADHHARSKEVSNG
jgi:hypothetical protein